MIHGPTNIKAYGELMSVRKHNNNRMIDDGIY